ncbi:MAG: RDD family protein [Candidatus Omnitrophica bacterium]|nr:RDD family protein [Candidatus Omnitrophota bacterium]
MQESISGGFSGGSLSAPKGKRFASALIDLFIIPILLGIVIGIALLAVPEGIRNILLIFVNIGWLLFRDLVYSPGRHMVGLKLVSLTGAKVTLPQAFIRNVLIVLPFVLVVGYIVEIIAIFSKGDRVADGWAKTRVVSAS